VLAQIVRVLRRGVLQRRLEQVIFLKSFLTSTFWAKPPFCWLKINKMNEIETELEQLTLEPEENRVVWSSLSTKKKMKNEEVKKMICDLNLEGFKFKSDEDDEEDDEIDHEKVFHYFSDMKPLRQKKKKEDVSEVYVHSLSEDEDDGEEDEMLYNLFKLTLNYAEGMDVYDPRSPPTQVVTWQTRATGAVNKERVLKHGKCLDELTHEEHRALYNVFYSGPYKKKNLRQRLEVLEQSGEDRFEELRKESFLNFFKSDSGHEKEGVHAQFMHACKDDDEFNAEIDFEHYKNWPCVDSTCFRN